ncbi:hypothetical protein GGX14DRAFT_649888 [Mycena pura]|uniref:Uncharacterized protein n=1 Tax=Mycena pura TaxID=153505 RepID=A0AAD7E2R8_9AGAR|nr:hypothetical protein GGX14DRAFT_649888 [Mycena pura]
MPYPSPIITELNLLFENRSPRKVQPTSLPCLLPHRGSSSPSLASSSPASSTSTLLDDDEVQSILTSAKSLEVPMTPRENLNPLAAAFVPRFRQQPSPSVKQVTLHDAKPHVQPQPDQPMWFDAFSRGACTSGTSMHEQYAVLIVTSRLAWPIEAMGELAQHFSRRGSEKIQEESAGIAPFAFMVYRQFFELCGEEIAQSFIWHLRECVIGAFIASWDPDSSTAITYRNAPSFNYVASAIAQATFIGQLFTLDLIPGPHTATCMVTLLKGLNSYEHLEGLRSIIASAGPTFWHGSIPGQGNIAIHKFVATFLEAVAPLRANMSVLGRALGASEMRGIIVEVEQLVTGWVHRG